MNRKIISKNLNRLDYQDLGDWNSKFVVFTWDHRHHLIKFPKNRQTSKPQDNLKTCSSSTQNSFRFFIAQFALSTFPIDVLHSNQMSQSLSRIQHRTWRVVPEQLAKMSKEFFLSFIRQRKSRKSEAMGESRTINNENNSISHNCSFDKLPVMCRCNDIIIYCSTSGDESERGGGKDDVDGEKLK